MALKLSITLPNGASGDYLRLVNVEWDRNLIWLFANHGIYAVSTPLLGEVVTGPPSAS